MGLSIFGIPIEVIQAFFAAQGIATEQQQSDELIKRDDARFAEGTGIQRSQLAQLVAQAQGQSMAPRMEKLLEHQERNAASEEDAQSWKHGGADEDEPAGPD